MSLTGWVKRRWFSRRKYIPIWASLACGACIGRIFFMFNEEIPGSVAIGLVGALIVYVMIFSFDIFGNEEGYM